MKLRSQLQSYERFFVERNRREIQFHRDIAPIEKDYKRYKQIKQEIAKTAAQLEAKKKQMSRDL